MADALNFNSGMGRDQFLQLLVAQLQNQDPLQPVQQQEYLQQLSSFSLLEGMEDLNASFGEMLKMQQLTQGAGLAGKVISFDDPNTGEELLGRISEVRVENGQILLQVGNYAVKLDDVNSVVADDAIGAA